jgi:hypothetical protein
VVPGADRRHALDPPRSGAGPSLNAG